MGPEWLQAALGSVAVTCTCFANATACHRPAPDAVRETEVDAHARECSSAPPLAQKAAYRVGFLQAYEPTNPYTIANTADMVATAKKRGYDLVYNPPATADAAEQVARTQALVAANVDVIVMRPLASLGPAVVAARKACIPVFTEGRSLDPAGAVAGTDFVTHVGTDSSIQGRLIADWLIKKTQGHANIIELEGTAGTSPALGRKKGFDETIASQTGMKILASQSGNFDRATGHDVAARLFAQNPTATVIYTHNDQMALGALDAVRELGKRPGKDVLIVSIDGLKEAVQHVIDGTIAAIEFNDPKLAAVAFDAMERYASGQSVPPRIVVKGPIIDSTNASTMISEAF